MNKRKALIIFFIAIIVIIILLLRSCGSQETEKEQKHLDYEPIAEQEYINVPAVSQLVFDADALSQSLQLDNDNMCYMEISIYLSDDTLIYKSGQINPNEHITDIELLQPLKRGRYNNCTMLYEFFSLDDNTALNSAVTTISITAL